MLLGQQFRGGHECRLVSRGHRHQQAVERDDGLARTDITLKQTVHGDRGLQVRGDLMDDRTLRAGQLKRESRGDMGVDGVIVLQRDRTLSFAAVPTLQHHRKLQQQQLVECQAAPCGDRLVGVGGSMHHAISLGQGGQSSGLSIFVMQMVIELGQGGVENRLDRPLDGPGRQLFAGRIDWPMALRPGHNRLIGVVGLPSGVDHLHQVAMPLRPAPHQNGQPGMDLLA